MNGYLGDFPTNHTKVCFGFGSFDSLGASSAASGFAAADVKVYKDGATTERASASGITIAADFDSRTGINTVVIDLSDNADAGFYAAGHEYQAFVDAITVDGQTVRFPLGSFSIERAGGALAIVKAVLVSPLTESYAGTHVVPTFAQLLFEVRAILCEKFCIGATVTTRKVDGSTPAVNYLFNSATNPTAITRL